MSELKPCPFCGGAAVLEDGSPDDPMWGTPSPWWFGSCNKCDLHFCADDQSKDGAIKAWNTRAEDPRLAVALEALRDIADVDKADVETAFFMTLRAKEALERIKI